MQWVLDNWVWLLLGGGMIAMHLFGHGSHGGHGGHGKNRAETPSPEPTPDAAPTAESVEKRRDL